LPTIGAQGYGHDSDIGDDELPSSAGDVSIGGSAIAIAAGSFHTCAILEGDGHLICWGRNEEKQLVRHYPPYVGYLEVPSDVGPAPMLDSVVAVSAGAFHTCVLLADGSVECFGEKLNGRLGYGPSLADSPTWNADDDAAFPLTNLGPVPVGATVVAVELGVHHTCVILESGMLRCWGQGTDGKLGYGNEDDIGDDETPGFIANSYRFAWVDHDGVGTLLSAGFAQCPGPQCPHCVWFSSSGAISALFLLLLLPRSVHGSINSG
jgi:Regulator of chromosome condensation (RCC1) repeat